jgi:hypothetical protein
VNTTARSVVLKQVSELVFDSSVLIKVKGYNVGLNMPEYDMQFTVTVLPKFTPEFEEVIIEVEEEEEIEEIVTVAVVVVK